MKSAEAEVSLAVLIIMSLKVDQDLGPVIEEAEEADTQEAIDAVVPLTLMTAMINRWTEAEVGAIQEENTIITGERQTEDEVAEARLCSLGWMVLYYLLRHLWRCNLQILTLVKPKNTMMSIGQNTKRNKQIYFLQCIKMNLGSEKNMILNNHTSGRLSKLHNLRY